MMSRLLLTLSAIVFVGCASGDADPVGTLGDSSIAPHTEAGTDASADGRSDTKADGPSSCDPSSDTCPPSQYCSAVTHGCLDGCRLDTGCPTTKPHCDVLSHTCASCLTTDQCPSGQACSDHVCVPGCSATRPCGTGSTCCGGACVDVKTNAENCGTCGVKCAAKNGTSTCSTGACVIATCNATFADCDSKYDDGCESVLTSDAKNCGKCGTVCSTTNGAASCATEKCAIACATNFGDCNGTNGDGCEVDLRTDPKNCGKCGTAPSETCNLSDDNCNGVCDDVDGCRVGVHRSVSSTTGEHFYTESASEAACCSFIVETLNFYYLYSAAAPGLVPFYRCAGTRHFYTTDPSCEGIGTSEGSMGFIATSPTCGATPPYRVYQPTADDHFYTTSAPESAAAISGGYIDQGIAGYVWIGPRP